MDRGLSSHPTQDVNKIKAPVAVFTPRRGNPSVPIPMDIDIMTLHHKAERCQLPDLFDWVTEQDSRVTDHRVRWVARRCRVPFATAETIIANAGFSDGERRQ